MAITGLNAYLNFNGTASDAIAFYERAVDARTTVLQRFGDAPGGACTGEDARQVMHARLDIGGGVVMISDAMPGSPVGPGSNTRVCIQYDDVADIDRHFAALADGGIVVAPLDDMFWGARFGMLVDRYGIAWMLNAERAQ